MSLPMTTFWPLETASTTTAVMVHGLPSIPPHKAMQVTAQTELQDRNIHSLKSIFPLSS
ncbi:hypothetical protein BD779DRAFT_1543151 [Infundibulicybe gibba]|nr:hypothetical protein BD779DRAFT_1543151 [Infundibulicybe gibba]